MRNKRNSWSDEIVDLVLEILIFPLYGASIFLPLAGIGSIIHEEYKVGVLWLLAALACYSLAIGTGKYFDYKKGG